MSVSYHNGGKVVRSRFFYGWVVVGASLVLLATNSAIVNSFGVFFKPLAADFGWSRATTSGVQSIFSISFGVFAIAAGWLADRFGPVKILVICGTLAGLGLILTSQIGTLWQIYLTYSLMTSIGLCSTFPITGIATARWFVERRGLALGIVSSGTGLGQLVGVPNIARLIADFGWSRAYFVLGVVAWGIMVGCALLLRRSPQRMEFQPGRLETPLTELRTYPAEKTQRSNPGSGVTLLAALRTKTLWVMFSIFFLFAFCGQLIAVHLVNYATDLGIAPIAAATLVSGIGLGSVLGRLLMGTASDRIGNLNTLIVACLGIAPSLIWLGFAGELWMFYLFAVIFGFSYGAEVPQQIALIGKFFSLRVVLVGIAHSSACFGGALGSWVGGQVFDVTQSYQVAFLMGVAAIISALMFTLVLKRRK